MIIHKLIATCDCNNEKCIGHNGGAVVNITLSAIDEIDIDFLTTLVEKIEVCATRVEKVEIRADQLSLLRAAIEDCYKIPEFTDKFIEALGIKEKKEDENPFDNLEELELKENG